MMEQLSFDLPPAGESLIQLWTPTEIYDRLDADNVHLFAEDRRVERKGPSVQARALAEYLSMWSNTQPHGGLIIVGVGDDGSIKGCKSLGTSGLNNLESLTPLCEDARWACKHVRVLNHKGEEDFVVAYRVEYRPGRVVETSSREAFIREGDKKIRILESMKRELQISKREIHYDLESVNLIYPDDFDVREIDKFCKAFYVNRRFQEPKARDELMELAKLGKRNGANFAPNLACTLLFARDPREVIPGARIRIIRYEGKEERFGTEMNAVFSTFVDGCISKLLFDARPIIASQLRTLQRFSGGGRIESQHEYPEEAWFEAVVNAVAHRSYNLRTQNIFVKIFDDRFIVESPGGFVPPTTATTVYDAHNPRNPYLMEAMMHLELTFCGFEGTRRMRKAMQSAHLPDPRFKQIEAHAHQVHVILENDIAARRPAPTDETLSLSMDEFMALPLDERAILNFLMTSNEINITHASLLIRKSWPTASKVIGGLLERGLLEQISKRGRSRDATKTYRIRPRT